MERLLMRDDKLSGEGKIGMIRNVDPTDAQEICRIYNHYVEKTIVTFEEDSVSSAAMKQRILEISKDYPWIIYVDGGRIMGYAYASRWRSRSAYQYSVESTVYVHPDTVGKGIGVRVYRELLRLMQNRGYHTVLGCIALPNEASVALHEKLGFKKVAHFQEVGFKFGKWIDVGYWELIFKGAAPDS
jgi:L-amino acid N-acyltransferase YncA